MVEIIIIVIIMISDSVPVVTPPNVTRGIVHLRL